MASANSVCIWLNNLFNTLELVLQIKKQAGPSACLKNLLLFEFCKNLLHYNAVFYVGYAVAVEVGQSDG